MLNTEIIITDISPLLLQCVRLRDGPHCSISGSSHSVVCSQLIPISDDIGRLVRGDGRTHKGVGLILGVSFPGAFPGPGSCVLPGGSPFIE